jgi:hypothetical protein
MVEACGYAWQSNSRRRGERDHEWDVGVSMVRQRKERRVQLGNPHLGDASSKSYDRREINGCKIQKWAIGGI